VVRGLGGWEGTSKLLGLGETVCVVEKHPVSEVSVVVDWCIVKSKLTIRSSSSCQNGSYCRVAARLSTVA